MGGGHDEHLRNFLYDVVKEREGTWPKPGTLCSCPGPASEQAASPGHAHRSATPEPRAGQNLQLFRGREHMEMDYE